jgi:uncharacterized tellurite resistance protein B-like protein
MEYEEFSDLLFDSYYDPLKKDRLKSHFSALLAVAKIDGEIKSPEIDFLNRIAQNMDLSEEDYIEAIENPLPPLPPLSTKEKIKNLVEIAIMICIDGPLDPSELQICNLLANKYGLNDSKMNIICSKVHSGLKENQINIYNYNKIVDTLYNELKNSIKETKK